MLRCVLVVTFLYVGLSAVKRFRYMDALAANNVSHGDSPAPTLEQLGMFNETLSADVVLRQYYKYSTAGSKQYPGEVLTYVTPWNRRGYSMAVGMAHKIDWLVPVWFQIRRNEKNGEISITGTHEIDKHWMAEVRQAHRTRSAALTSAMGGVEGLCVDPSMLAENEESCVARCTSASPHLHIVPRVALETPIRFPPNPATTPKAVAAFEKDVADTARLLDELRRRHGLDGFTFEIAMEYYKAAHPIVKTFRNLCPSCKLLFVLPPMRVGGNPSLKAALLGLHSFVDRFPVMTYDYPRTQPTPVTRAGLSRADEDYFYPNAPLQWSRDVLAEMRDMHVKDKVAGKKRKSKDKGQRKESVLESKYLWGLPMYGWQMPDNEAVTGEGYIKAVDAWRRQSNSKKRRHAVSEGLGLFYDEVQAEHFLRFSSGKDNRVLSLSFPSPLFLRRRLEASLNVTDPIKLVPDARSRQKNHEDATATEGELPLARGVALWELGQMLPMYADIF